MDHIGQLHNLRALQISNVAAMTDAVLTSISVQCAGLEVLELNQNEHITDQCAVAIRQLPLLKLNLARTKVTDTFLVGIKGGCVADHLEEINLCHCAVTSAGLKQLQWDKMKYIGFEGAVIDGH